MNPLTELRPKITIALFGELRALNNEESAMRDRVLDLITQDRKVWGEYVNSQGHWFAKEKKLDAYWNFGYWCNCGYKSSERKFIENHVQWKQQELLAGQRNQEEGK